MDANYSELKDLLSRIGSDKINEEFLASAIEIFVQYKEQCSGYESLYHKALVSNLDDGQSVSEATVRAKAETPYELKQNMESYAEAVKLLINSLDNFLPHLK